MVSGRSAYVLAMAARRRAQFRNKFFFVPGALTHQNQGALF